MQIPIGPLIGFAAIVLILFATLYDVAMIAGRALTPWFGWMLP